MKYHFIQKYWYNNSQLLNIKINYTNEVISLTRDEPTVIFCLRPWAAFNFLMIKRRNILFNVDNAGYSWVKQVDHSIN